MAEPGSAPTPAPVPQGSEVPQVAPQVSPEALKQAQESIAHAEAKEKLDALRASIMPTVAPKEGAATGGEHLPEVQRVLDGSGRVFSMKDGEAFFNALKSDFRSSGGVKKLSEQDRSGVEAAYVGQLFDSFRRAVIATCPAILADGVPDDIQIQVVIKNGVVDEKKGVSVKKESKEKYDAAVVKLEELAKEALKQQNVAGGAKSLEQFAQDFPQAFAVLSFMYGPQKMQEIFTNPMQHQGLSFIFGAMGYGAGYSMYSSIFKDKKFSGFMDSAFGMLSDMTKGMLDFRSVNEVKDSAEFEKLLQPKAVIRKRFKASVALNITAPIRIASIAFPADYKLNTSSGMENFTKETEHKEIVLTAGQQIPAGAVFRDVQVMAVSQETSPNQPTAATVPATAAATAMPATAESKE